jgi:exopolyphosphatase/guanosine-5'-triphosphate,3'-diphosphate pyrophosphatase
VGRLTDEDPRERTVSSMQRRYHVDLEQSHRIELTALRFLSQAAKSWSLDHPQATLALKWAARLHEIGLDVAHSGYHRHGAYLLENADMPGFAREEQRLLARLVGGHRRKLLLTGVEELIPPWDTLAVRLIVLLRLAVLLHRGRSATPLPPMRVQCRARSITLHLSRRWLKQHPLSAEDLRQEISFLQPLGLRLRVYAGGRDALP